MSATREIGNILERFSSYPIQPVLTVGTSILCHSLLYIHPFCLTIQCTCFVYSTLCDFVHYIKAVNIIGFSYLMYCNCVWSGY